MSVGVLALLLLTANRLLLPGYQPLPTQVQFAHARQGKHINGRS